MSIPSPMTTQDLSASSFESLATRLAAPAGDAAWGRYRGQGDGSLYVGGYTGVGAPFVPMDPIAACEGACRSSFVSNLNATSLL